MTVCTDLAILIVDDEPDVGEGLRTYLELRGLCAEVVTSPRAALERVANQRYDLVFSDIMMPEMDGVELLHRIKQKQADAIVVMITASASLAKVLTARLGGASDYVLKPFQDFGELDAVIDQACRQVQRWNLVLDSVREKKGP